jgi:hypothetical protein
MLSAFQAMMKGYRTHFSYLGGKMPKMVGAMAGPMAAAMAGMAGTPGPHGMPGTPGPAGHPA